MTKLQYVFLRIDLAVKNKLADYFISEVDELFSCGAPPFLSTALQHRAGDDPLLYLYGDASLTEADIQQWYGMYLRQIIWKQKRVSPAIGAVSPSDIYIFNSVYANERVN